MGHPVVNEQNKNGVKRKAFNNVTSESRDHQRRGYTINCPSWLNLDGNSFASRAPKSALPAHSGLNL